MGALIAFQRKDSLKPYIDKGTPLDAAVNENLLVTIFWPMTPLHDGALVIRGGRLAAAACVLPIGQGQVPPTAALRHRAALGLAEQTDALVIVVSEETGKIAVARDARVDVLEGFDDLRRLLGATAGGGK